MGESKDIIWYYAVKWRYTGKSCFAAYKSNGVYIHFIAGIENTDKYAVKPVSYTFIERLLIRGVTC